MLDPDLLHKDLCPKFYHYCEHNCHKAQEPMEPKAKLSTNSTVKLVSVRVTPTRMQNPQRIKKAYGSKREGS